MNESKKTIVITSINAPNEAFREIVRVSNGGKPGGWDVLVIGDTKTPTDWKLDGAVYMSVDAQRAMSGNLAALCPVKHYARKNLGYLKAMQNGSGMIAETDDDNLPYDGWLAKVSRTVTARAVKNNGWENVYRHYTKERIWPRGLPLEQLHASFEADASLEAPAQHDCPIQQFLANDNPDVDAVYRLVLATPVKFKGLNSDYVVLNEGTYCPFNSQNTVWWPDAYELMYLPAFVSFRMTDIWRSFVAQVCLFRMGKPLLFGPATMYQVRNEHNLLRDFADEVPGYLNNQKIMDTLNALDLKRGAGHAGDNLHKCYEALVVKGIVPKEEMPLVEAWLTDVRAAKG